MTQPTFEHLRIPAALILIIAAVFIFLPRDGENPTRTAEDPADSTATSGRPAER